MSENDKGTVERPGLACAVLLARFHGIPAELEPLAHRFPRTARGEEGHEVVRALRYLGLKAREVGADWPALSRHSLPAIARWRDGRFVAVAKVEGERALIQDPAAAAPATLSRAELEAQWSGRLILAARRALLPGGDGRFGLFWFLPAVVKYRRLLGEVLVASFFLQLFALVSPLFFQVVIDKVLVHKGLTTLDVLAGGLLTVSLFEAVLGGLRTYLFSHTTNRIDVTLGANLFHHLLELPLAYFEARRVGDSVARVRELENIRRFLTGSAVTVVIDLFFTVVFLAVMYYYSPTLTLVVLASLPLYVLLSLAVTPVLRRRLDEKFSRGAENQAFLVEAVTGVQTVKALCVEPQLQRHWEEQLAEYVRASFRAANLGNIAGQAAGFVNKLTTVAILWWGAHLAMAGELSVGQLVAFNMLAGRVSGPVLRLVQLWQEFQQAGLSLRRLADILDTPGERRRRAAVGLPRLEGRVSFQGVTFRYRPDAAEALRDLSWEAAPGEVIGIVGRSGSGKSTLAKLLQRLYLPAAGRILVDGVDLALVDPAWLRRQVGVVLQESFLFNRSIRDNIALADPGLPMERVIRAAQLAGAHDFILELPEGYDTVVGERGATLSGGQRQRVAIARALVTDPRVLIFDEATSALDYESERVIQENMRQICRGRTVFVIAHRLSAVRPADRILVLERGRLAESGSHDELLRRGGIYAGLWSYQAGPPPLAAGAVRVAGGEAR